VGVYDPDAGTVIASSDGILVHALDIPDPLAVEFKDGVVARVIGGATELALIRSSLTPGRSRAEVLRALREHARHLVLTVQAFVPNGDGITLPPTPDVRRRVLDADRWRFDASPSLCGFEVFYSQLELVFEHDRLFRLEHFCFSYELP